MSLESELGWIGRGETVPVYPTGNNPYAYMRIDPRTGVPTQPRPSMIPGAEAVTKEEAQGKPKPMPMLIQPSVTPEPASPSPTDTTPYGLYIGLVLAAGLVYIGYNYYRKGKMW